VFQITYDGQFLKKKKEVVWVIDKRTSEMYDEYKLGSKCLWKPVHELPKSTVVIFVLVFI